jgi:hypothetical protein
MSVTSRVRLAIVVPVLALAALAMPRAASAENARFALVVEGASGEEQYAVQHRRWVDGLVTTLRERFKYDASHLTVLAEQPKEGEEKATAENVKLVLGRLAKTMTSTDQLIIVLIGHGSGDAADAKFNLVGPDLSVTEWSALLKPVQGHLAIVDTTSSSFPYLAGLAAPGRVVITATSSFGQRYHTQFPEGFVQALASPDADLDKDGRISLLEAFVFASRSVKTYYDQKGTMATESSLMDDTGTGKGTDAAAATSADASLAALTYFDTPVVATSSDPETQRLLARQQALNTQLDELRRKKASMPADEYDKQFEALMLDLASVSRDIRTKTQR